MADWKHILRLLGCWPFILLLSPWIISSSFAQPRVQGLTVMDKATRTPVVGTAGSFQTLQLAPIMAQQNRSLESLLQDKGIDTDSAFVESLRALNVESFEGNRPRPGAFVYAPVPKFADANAFARYSIKFSDHDLSRLQLKSDALTVRDLGSEVGRAARGTAPDPFFIGQADMLQKMAKDLDLLGDRYSSKFGASELAAVSFQKDVAEYLAKGSIEGDSKKRLQNYHLLKEATDIVSSVAEAADGTDPKKKLGRRVTIHYAYIPSKKPLPGKQLYAIARGMRAIPGNFSKELFVRALEMGRFIGPTSPSSRSFPVGNFSVIAGPVTVTQAFVDKLMNDPDSLDTTTVVVSGASDQEPLEFYLPVRHPQ